MRIRSIKPEFWRSHDVSALSVEDRLLFIGLWSYVDDNGVGRDDLATIVAELFAADMLANPRETVERVHRGLSNLSEASLVVRYSALGKDWLAITTWSRHQKIDKPGKPRYPGPDQAIPESSRDPREASRDSRETLGPGTEEQRNRGTEEKSMAVLRTTEVEPPSKEVVRFDSRPAGRPSGRRAYPNDFEAFWDAYPRHEKKGDALKAWEQAKRLASIREIIAGARRYADDPNRTPTYTQHPATWLRARGWEDEPLPQREPASKGDRLQAAVGQMLQDLGAGPTRGVS